jgi:hypothetical protein
LSIYLKTLSSNVGSFFISLPQITAYINLYLFALKNISMKPTLLILAAGMGSRYGGLKQIDGIGPNDEPIIEYSIYDAINSGFGKIVFVIRREFDEAFRSRFEKITIEYVYQ